MSQISAEGSFTKSSRDGSSRAGFEKREKRRNIRQLQSAISSGDVTKVQEIISHDFDIDFQYNSQTSLQLAVCQGSEEICALLIKKGANVNQADADGNSLLNMACWRGFADVARLLIKHGADVDSQNESGNTSLNVCAYKSFTEIAEILLSASCDTNIANKKGHTPLYCVAESGNVSMVRQLLKAKADPDWGDHSMKTPLMAAAEAGHVQVVKTLLDGGADVNKQTRDGRTAAFYTASCGQDDVLTELVQSKVDLNLVTTKGTSPLLEAISMKHPTAASLLIQSKCDVNLADRLQQAPIHAAITQASNTFDPNHTTEMHELVRLLVDAGADVNKQDKEGWTPLYQATSAGDLQLCKFLLEKHAAIDKVTKQGSSILHGGVYGGKYDIVKLCLDAGCQVNSVDDQGQHALLAAVSSRCSFEIIQLLLDAGSDVNIAHRVTKHTALHEAVCQHYTSAAQLLIDRGSDMTRINYEKKSSLYLACQRGLSELVTYMLEKGGCPVVSRNIAALPIHAAALQGRASTIQVLSAHGCNLNQMNSKGETPLMAAAGEDNFSAVRALLQCGCDLEYQYKLRGLQLCCIHQEDPHPHLGLEPLFLAMTHKNLDMMRMLLQCYRQIPRKTIRLLDMLLRRTEGLNTHFTQKQKQEVHSIFIEHTRTPFSLADACRRITRASLGSPIQVKVSRLPVGEKVKQYILMETEFQAWQELEQVMPGGSCGISDLFVRHDPF